VLSAGLYRSCAIRTHWGQAEPLDLGMPTERHRVLLVMSESDCAAHSLPNSGNLTLGRASDNSITIDDPSVSRFHARLRLSDPILIEDLDSANGTFVRSTSSAVAQDGTARTNADEQRVTPGKPMPVSPGTLIYLGSVVIMLQEPAEGTRGRRTWPHDYFLERLEEECARAEREHSDVAVARLRVGSSERASALESKLDTILPASAVLASYGPGEMEVLLPGLSRDALPERVAAWTEQFQEAGLDVEIGVGSAPADGRSPEALLAAASNRLQGDRAPAEGDRTVVRDPKMVELSRMLERVARTEVTVLLLGETGVGKEVMAERIHELSPRARGKLVRLNCAALPEPLLESELFGHERGAFTGATATKPGLLEGAEGGTVFLDEIGEMPLGTQAKLLRVIEERKVRRLGARQPRDIDVRLVAATNRDLSREVSEGRFREDLFFRLNVFPIVIPPLRERVAEIEPLAEMFLSALSTRMRRPVPSLSPGATKALLAHDYPGNIRELRNALERALVLCTGDVITEDSLTMARSRRSERAATEPPASAALDLKAEMMELERQRIVEALDECAGNQTRAAKLLGISRRMLVKRLGAYGLPRPRKSVGP
jgi:two-component system, NtrC family, response regulator AtoC